MAEERPMPEDPGSEAGEREHAQKPGAVEHEYKFSPAEGAPPEEAELRRVLGAAGFELSEPEFVLQQDVYFDDRRRTLAAAGVALRRREVGGRQLATFKGVRQGRGALYAREELELPMVGGDGEPGAWPPPVARRAAEYGPLHSLRPVLELTTRRRRYGVRRGTELLAELAVDDVRANLPGSETQVLFAELELEARGAPAGLEPLAALLQAELQLTASPAGKLERARALLSLGAALGKGR